MFGLGERKLTSKERQYIKTWALEYNFSDEMILEGFKLAVERNIADKGMVGYVNSIYLSWHEKGFKEVKDVKSEFQNNYKNNNYKTSAKPQSSGFNSDQFFEKLVKNSRKLLE